MEDVDPVEGNEGIADRKADGTNEDDDGQAGEGGLLVGPDFPGMGFLFGRRRFADQR